MTIPFVDSVRSLQDGATNNVVSKMQNLRYLKNKADSVVGTIDSTLTGMSNLTSSGFSSPSIPDIGDINTAMGQASVITDGVIADISTITDLTGGCLSKAIGTLGSMVGDTSGVIRDAMNSIQGFVAPEIAQLQKLMDVHRQFLMSLGVDKLIAELTSGLGCLSDAGVIGDIVSEANSIVQGMGLNSQGMPDNATYYQLMKSKMTASGLTAGYVDDLSAATSNMSTQAAALAGNVKSSAIAQAQALTSPITKVPTLPASW